MRSILVAFATILTVSSASLAQTQTFNFSGVVDYQTAANASVFGFDAGTVGRFTASLVFDNSQTSSDATLFAMNPVGDTAAQYRYESFSLNIGNVSYSHTGPADLGFGVSDAVLIIDRATDSGSADQLTTVGNSDVAVSPNLRIDATSFSSSGPFDRFSGAEASLFTQDIYNTLPEVVFGGGGLVLFSTFDVFGNQIFMSDPLGDALSTIRLSEIQITSVTSAIPEPATWLMMIIGFAGVGLMIKRRRKFEAFLKTNN
jgi:hypothetical protein